MARSQLRTLFLGHPTSPPAVNLAELFAGGNGLPSLYELRLKNLSLEWSTAGLANTPTAPEFATRARALLPSLVKLDVQEGPRLDLPTEEFNKACRRHVLLALQLMVRRAVRPPPPDPHRAAGNAAYREARWADAIAAYRRSLGAIPGTPAWVAAINNTAAAKLAAGDVQGALFDAGLVLAANPLNVKGFLRHGAACERLGGFDVAVEDYETR